MPEEIMREFSGVMTEDGLQRDVLRVNDLYLVQLSKETSQNVPNCYVCFIVVFFLFQIKNISKLAEVSKNNALQLSEKLRNMKNQSESEEEKMNLLIKKLKMFLLEDNTPPEDIERFANRVLDIHLPVTSQNLTHEFDKIRKLLQLCEDYRTEENRLHKAADGARKVLVKAKAAE
ncbi:hypothetical protein DBR06_SOUSAS32610003 [Sousa chinensis]|uniref:LAMB1/2/3/4 helical domain-containing protein n=1 Tax=Sousa chinensis TaxID=103600 RepID=A0A484GVD9_SOUCH|nr:hypothetical protein DBR06_SOUSAS32610003 [Sousa chinensis]